MARPKRSSSKERRREARASLSPADHDDRRVARAQARGFTVVRCDGCHRLDRIRKGGQHEEVDGSGRTIVEESWVAPCVFCGSETGTYAVPVDRAPA